MITTVNCANRFTNPFKRPTPSGCLAALLFSVVLLQADVLLAQGVAVRNVEGTVRGFLTLSSLDSKVLALGSLTQVIKRGRVESRLTFRFKDGSLDDESAVFSQRKEFRLLSYHHVQKGPSFPHPIDVSIDVGKGQITLASEKNSEGEFKRHYLDLPPDVANGLILTLVKNIPSDALETELSFVAPTSKPQIMRLTITPQGEENFSVAGFRQKATRYVVKVELGRIKGTIASLLGKEIEDTYIWILGGKAPAFLKSEGPLYHGGPVWKIELAKPVWQRSQQSAR